MANKVISSDEYEEDDQEEETNESVAEVPTSDVSFNESKDDTGSLIPPIPTASVDSVDQEPIDELEYQLNAEQREKYKIESGHYYTDPSDGTCYEWDEAQRAWFPRVTEDFLAAYQMSYGTNDFTKSTVQTDLSDTINDKKTDNMSDQQDSNYKPILNEFNNIDNDSKCVLTPEIQAEASEDRPIAKKLKKAPEWFEMESNKNTWIYISGLPLNMTSDEFLTLVGKYGLVMEDPINEKKKFKMYTDEEGNFKGDAKCCYLRKESIPLAVQMLHGTKLSGSSSRVKVEEAKFVMKGEFDPKLKPKKKNTKKKKKTKQENLLDWRDRAGGNDLRPKHAKIVIMKHCFDPKQFLEDACLITEIRDDIREECEKLGPVKKVLLFDRHPEGIVSIKFGTHEAADDAVKGFDKRWFASKQIEAHLWDGVTDYAIEETNMEREARLASWHTFIGDTEDKKPPLINDDINPHLCDKDTHSKAKET